jgi:hypothetical protein
VTRPPGRIASSRPRPRRRAGALGGVAWPIRRFHLSDDGACRGLGQRQWLADGASRRSVSTTSEAGGSPGDRRRADAETPGTRRVEAARRARARAIPRSGRDGRSPRRQHRRTSVASGCVVEPGAL